MKIALASAPVKNLDIDFNLQAIVDAMAACSGKADLILFGESVLQGFDCLCWEYEKVVPLIALFQMLCLSLLQTHTDLLKSIWISLKLWPGYESRLAAKKAKFTPQGHQEFSLRAALSSGPNGLATVLVFSQDTTFSYAVVMNLLCLWERIRVCLPTT